MELIPQGYIARYTMEDITQFVAANLKSLGKELTKLEPTSRQINGKTVLLFECQDSADQPKPKKKYNRQPKQIERGQPLRQQPEHDDLGEFTVSYSMQDAEGKEVLAGPVTPL